MNDGGKTKFEILKMARELLNEEYINRRAEDHNKWLSECDAVWKNQGIKLPYPQFAPYPSEAEILARAQALYSFISAEEKAKAPTVAAAVPEPVEPTPVPELTVATPVPDPVPAPIVEPDTSADSVQPKPLFANKVVLPTEPTTSSALKNLLPSWLQNKDNNV
jgi:hypothetical protein